MGETLGQMHAVGADSHGEAGVGADQQLQTARTGDGLEPQGLGLRVGRPEGAEDDARAARQGLGDRLGVGRARGIGEEQQRRQGLSRAGGAI
jgi:hypothetical protein